MFENHVIQTRGFHNTVDKEGNISGFQFCMRAYYYRVLWLSQFRPGEVSVDGVAVPRQDIRWEVNGVDYKYEELVKAGGIAWQVTEAATVKIIKPGGLAQGYHELSVKFGWICNYIDPGRFDPVLGINFHGYEHKRRLLIV